MAGRRGLGRGIGLTVIGVLVMIAGGLALAAAQAVARFTPAAEFDMPGEVTFEAEARRYGLSIFALGDDTGETNATRCTVTLANERQLELRGDRTVASVETAGGIRFATFDAPAGRTTVACEYGGTLGPDSIGDTRLVVAPVSTTARIGMYVLLGGVAVTLVGVLLILRAVFRGQGSSSGAPMADGAEPAAAAAGGLGAIGLRLQQAAADAMGAAGGAGGAAVSASDMSKPLDPSTLPPIEGVDWPSFVAIEAGLIRDRVAPAAADSYAAAHGVAPGSWAAAKAGWHARIHSDWRVGAAFGQAMQDAQRRR